MSNFIVAADICKRSHRGTQFRIWATQATIRKFRIVRLMIPNRTIRNFRIVNAAAPTCKQGLQVRYIDNVRTPFSQHGGLGKACLRGAKRGRQVHQLFGDKLNTLIDELNETLAA